MPSSDEAFQRVESQDMAQLVDESGGYPGNHAIDVRFASGAEAWHPRLISRLSRQICLALNVLVICMETRLHH